MLLFSATYDKTVMAFAEVVVPDPVTIKLRREEETLENIRQVSLSSSACMLMINFYFLFSSLQ